MVEERMKVITVINQKGGVGKTTTVVNLSAELSRLGYRILTVDSDPQGNCSSGLGWGKEPGPTMYECLVDGVPARVAIVSTAWGPDLLPSGVSLAGAELDLAPLMSRENRLLRCLQGVWTDYDAALVDCPPALGLLTVNAMTAASVILVPIQCEYYAMEGLTLLDRTIQTVRLNLNPELKIDGILLTMYDQRTRLADEVAGQIREVFGSAVLNTVIPRNVALAEAPSFGQPVGIYASSSRGAEAYRQLAQEVEDKWLK